MLEDNHQTLLKLCETLDNNTDEVPFQDLDSARKILHAFLNQALTEEYQIFPSLRSQLVYFSERYRLSAYLYEQLKQILDFYALHRSPSKEQFAMMCVALYKLTEICHFSQNIDTAYVLTKLIRQFEENEVKAQVRSEEALLDFNAQIISLEQAQTHYQTTLLKMKAKSDIASEEILVYLWDVSSNSQLPYEKQFHRLADFYFQGCTVRFFNMRYHPAKQAYVQTEESFFVFMPDFLMDASAIAECFNQSLLPEAWLLKLFENNEFSEALLKGQIINQILDNMINRQEESPEQTINLLLQQNVLKALCLQDFNVHKMTEDILDRHLPNFNQLMSHFSEKKILTEPSFISPEYGIQGRLDGLIEEENQAFHKTIFELKSGKAPQYGTWKNHTAQVICYDFLLKSVFGKAREGYSMIFYSYAEKDPLRNVMIYPSDRLKVLMLRNQIVSYVFKIARGETDFVSLLENSSGRFPKWHQEKIEAMLAVVKASDSIQQTYFKTFTACIMRELINSKLGNHEDIYDYGFSALWSLDLGIKEKSGSVFSRLLIKEKQQSDLIFEVNPKYVSLNFREGDPVTLYGISKQVQNPSQTYLIKGSFIEYRNLYLKIKMRNECLDEAYFRQFDYFILEKDNLEFSHFALMNSMYDFMKASENRKQLLLGLQTPQSTWKDSEISDNTHADRAQRIIHKALAAKDYFIIQGPPGTGKTSKVIMGIVQQLLQKEDKPIVILAFTNKAVDEIISRLKQNQTEYIRLGSRHSNDSNHISHILDIDNREKSLALLMAAKVFVSTVSTFQNEGHFLLQLIPEGTLIVDEASQLLEPHLAGLCVRFKKWILIGDHYQLPAVSSDSETEVPILLQETIGLKRLNESLFERMIRLCQQKGWNHAWDILTEHYRMHDEIADLINHYYDYQLKSGSLIQTSGQCFDSMVSEKSDLFMKRRLFIPCRSSLKMKLNEGEATLIVNMVSEYEKAGILESYTIGIICFWKAQCNLIRQRLREAGINREIMTDTVERYQGSERDIIIVSTALSKTSDLEIVSLLTHNHQVDRKLNVAVSRAKRQFILLGDPDILNHSSHYRHLLSKLHRMNGEL
ncbi:MAG TPA: DEAD/DEAH box helicase [Candidatus Cloacimonadota bacterium]|nr:DEAD/DEAH box helicase [Candidatus Cloacimonadota bacterium]